MPCRRQFMQMALASAAMGPAGMAAAQDRFDQDALLDFWPIGTVTLMHFADLRGQSQPLYLRPPSDGLDQGVVPDLAPEDFRIRYGIGGRTPMDYAFTAEHYAEHARTYGKLGGVAHLSSILRAIRQLRPQSRLLDGGDGFERAFDPTGALAPIHRVLGTDLRHDLQASEVNLISFDGADIAVLAPRPQSDLQALVDKARAAGAAAVIGLSRAGFAADNLLAQQVKGLDIILSAGGFHALPEPQQVAGTRIIASGSHGCFLSRIDLEITEGKLTDMAHRLIPIFSDLIRPDPAMAKVLRNMPAEGARLGTAGQLLWRRGVVQSPWDDVICRALMQAHDTQVALAPGFRWGPSVLAGQAITEATVQALTIGPPAQTRAMEVSGQILKAILEDAAERCFSSNPFARHGRDMMRAGGLGFALDLRAPRNSRISGLRLMATGAPVQPDQSYRVAFWAAGPQAGKGPKIADVLSRAIKRAGRVSPLPASDVRLIRSD